jgi:glycosyltransferase involved in cell wall biosynthesis
MTVAAIVPARNEAASIAETVRALKRTDRIDDIIVVDDASTDATVQRAHEAGGSVLLLRRRVGKGAALRAGLKRTMADILVFIDADLGDSAGVAADLLEPVLAGKADMTIAAPPPADTSGFGLVETFARGGIRRLTRTTMSRPLSGQRALRREILERTKIASGFGVETALTVDALRSGYRVIELPLKFEHARTGRDLIGFAHRARQGFDISLALAVRFLRRRARP